MRAILSLAAAGLLIAAAGVSAGIADTSAQLQVPDWANGIHSRIFMFIRERLYSEAGESSLSAKHSRNRTLPDAVNALFESIYAE